MDRKVRRPSSLRRLLSLAPPEAARRRASPRGSGDSTRRVATNVASCRIMGEASAPQEGSGLNGKQWDQLFDGFSQRRRQQREQHANVRELVAWYDEQTEHVMTLVREVASERAAAFAPGSGLSVEVQWPSHPPINLDPEGPFMSFMRLRLPEREVHLYSHRVGSSAPLIHFVVADKQVPDQPKKRLLGRPGCRIERRDGGGFLLRTVGGEADGSIVSVDDLTYRAFELLLAD
jgi:hypothetical protein